MKPLILRLSQSGQPEDWIGWQEAVLLYAKDQVVWSLGERPFRFYGGVNRKQNARSYLDVDPIVAARGVAGKVKQGYISLTNRELFRRDKHICMYCLVTMPDRKLTRDHVIPISRGGKNVWTNVVTACRKCNQKKADKLLQETNMKLHAVPYTPNYAEWLILRNRNIQADQMAFLKEKCPKERRDMF